MMMSETYKQYGSMGNSS